MDKTVEKVEVRDSLPKKEKIKLLVYADGPMASTGFGNVNKNIIMRLLKTGKYEVHCLSINYYGDPHEYQGMKDLYCYPMVGDPFGKNRLFPLLMQVKPQILFCINDYDAVGHIPQILMEYKEKTKLPIRFVLHFPCDGSPVYPEYVEFLKRFVDKPVVISKFGQEQIQSVDPTFVMDQVYHGVDTDVFKELPSEFVHEQKEGMGNKFVVLAVGVNQLRKQYPVMLEAFAAFAKDKEDVLLLLHTQRNLSVGWNLDKLLRLFNIGSKCAFTAGLNGITGINVQDLNVLYNIADVYLSSSCGEGFNLSLLESMAAGCPVIVPNNSSMPEVVGDAAYMIETDHHTIFPNRDRELLRMIPSMTQIIKALNDFYYNTELRKEYRAKSLNWIRKMVHQNKVFNWDTIADYFDKEFEKLLIDNKQEEVLDIEEII